MSSILPLLEQAEDPKLLDALSRIGPAIVPQEKFNVFPIPYRSHVLVNPKSSYDADLTLSWLNSGVEKVIVPISWTKSLATLVPRERVVLFLDVSNISAVTDTVRNSVSGVLLKVSSYDLDLIRSIAQFFSGSEVYVLASEGVIPTIANVRELSTIPATLVLSSRYLTLGATTRTQINVGDAYAVRLVSDRPDGLFPTVVSNESGHTLGLVYSSAESVRESIISGRGTYFSRKHGLWRKGETSGATQDVISVYLDCDSDALNYRVVQHGTGFCHLQRFSCFHEATGLFGLEKILQSRLQNAPAGSYTQRLFNDSNLLKSKIMEEADELSRAETPEEIAFEAADLIYFALVKCTSAGVSIADIERSLDAKAKKITRRPGDAKPQWSAPATTAAPAAQKAVDPSTPISMRTVDLSTIPLSEQPALLKRPILNSSAMLAKVQPIVDDVRIRGDTALLELTAKFDKAQLATPILLPPFSPASMQLDYGVKTAIDRAYANIRLFHEAQNDTETLVVQTMPGVVCSRFARPIERVGLYVPGGTAILPSTALMLGIPAQVAGCETIVLATPPRADGSITPEVMYVAYLVGASAILKAGGAQAIAAMAYGTESVPKVDKIFGPGNQWVTAAKMLVQNDTEALVSIDMPAGPSEVLVIADHTANPIFVAADLLSQAEHGPDSQVILLAIALAPAHLRAIEAEIDTQARALPRAAIVRESIPRSVIVEVRDVGEAMRFSNAYAPEHLILHVECARERVAEVRNAGSVFVGGYTPESCGDYASGTNHTLPTYGYARQFSGVNTASFQKHITSQEITKEGLRALGPVVVTLAEREGLEAHANAVRVRLAEI